MTVKIYDNDTYMMHYRFYELLDLVNKADGRRELTLEDRGRVDNVDLFLTGCMSYFPVTIAMDGSTLNWRVLNGSKKLKTLIDFWNGEVTCQGKYISEIEGFLKTRVRNLEIVSHNIMPAAVNRNELREFLRE
jgi:hypothetical protein